MGPSVRILRASTLAIVGVLMLRATTAASAAQREGMEALPAKERVEGIGGFFFRAKSPKVLAAWYANRLGIALTPADYNHQPWQQTAGPTVFEPLPADSNLFERASQQFVLNFRVRNLDALVTQLRRGGVQVQRDPKEYPNGVFASLHDLEGNPIQLWQPAARR